MKNKEIFKTKSCVFLKENTRQFFKNLYKEQFSVLCRNLYTPPLTTTIRLNKLHVEDSFEEELKILKKHPVLENEEMKLSEFVPDCVVVKVKENENDVKLLKDFVVVDYRCGVAVLRGSNIYSPGILASSKKYLKIGEEVSIYCDPTNKIAMGKVLFEKEEIGRFHHVGNGVCTMKRKQIFHPENGKRSGLAIKLTGVYFKTVSLQDFTKSEKYFVQNLPSVLACHILDPQRGEVIVDLCAAPGGKTTHLANLMMNEGKIYAFDKSSQRAKRVKENAKIQKITIISTKKGDSSQNISILDGVRVDRVLCDVPCSGIGNRPQFFVTDKLEDLKLLAKYQRKIFNNAVSIVKSGGVIVYSTCTLNPLENEENVAYFLKKYSNLELVKSEKFSKISGFGNKDILKENYDKVIKFDPVENRDYISFFVAKFTKK